MSLRADRPTHQKQAGVALLAALILMLALVITLGNIFYRHQIDVSQATGSLHGDQAMLLAMSGENWALQLLSDGQDDFDVDDFSEDWAQAMPLLPVDGGTLTGCIADLQSRVNLNSFSGYNEQSLSTESSSDVIGHAKVWLALLRGLDMQVDPSRTAAIIDWLDLDSEIINSWGAEQPDYDGYSPSRVAANGLISDTTELAAIRGYEVAEVQRLMPWMSALPTKTSININTASAELLLALGGDLGLEFSDMVIAGRPFVSTEDFYRFVSERLQLDLAVVKGRWPLTLVGVNSSYFELYLEVTLGEARIEVKSIMDRQGRSKPVVISRQVTVVPASLPKPKSSAVEELFDDSSEQQQLDDEDQSMETSEVQPACMMIGEII
jgi:general secretion pathway protein K